MPAYLHTQKADTPKRTRQWNHVRASEIARGADAGTADRAANAVVKRSYNKSKRSRRSRRRSQR